MKKNTDKIVHEILRFKSLIIGEKNFFILLFMYL